MMPANANTNPLPKQHMKGMLRRLSTRERMPRVLEAERAGENAGGAATPYGAGSGGWTAGSATTGGGAGAGGAAAGGTASDGTATDGTVTDGAATDGAVTG